MMGIHSGANGVSVIQSPGGARILCLADVRGKLSQINAMAKKQNAQYVIHTGDFGFYDDESLDRMNEKTLKHVIQYSPLVPRGMGGTFAGSNTHDTLKSAIKKHSEPILSELPLYLNNTATLDVPVYTVWGACEDVRVLEKFRSGEYKVENLNIVDEHDSRLLEVGGLKLRLLGLGGAVVMHKLFDNGEGKTTIAGGQGTMWTTVLQMGELIETALATFDRSETRIFISHMSPGREGLLAQLALALRADFTISAGLHFRYGTSYNDFSVNPNLDHFRNRLTASRSSFSDVWDTVKPEVLPIVQPPQKKLIDNVLQIIEMASTGERGVTDEVGFKNLWNFNLPDANFGSLILEIKDGQVASEQRSEGFNFDYRRAERRVKPVATQAVEQNASQVPLPTPTPNEKAAPPVPAKDVAPPPAVRPPSPSAPSAEDTNSTTPVTGSAADRSTDRSSGSTGKQSFGRPTAQIWIGSPPDDVLGMFAPEHREKIKEHRSHVSRNTNQKYAMVYFHNVEDSTAAIESLNHAQLKYGDDYNQRGFPDRSGGSFSSRGGGSFSQSSYDARKSGGSDSENRGGFGRGGRGGRGAGRGSSTYSGRGGNSPAPRGSMRGGGRGGGGSSQKEVSGDKQEWTDKPESKEAGWSNEEKPPTIPTTSESADISQSVPHATASSGAQSSTVGESQSS